MTDGEWETTKAWADLLAGLRDLDKTFLEGPRAVHSESAIAEGYRMLATILGVGLDTYLFADRSRPVFIDVVTPTRRDRRWGGDNTDCSYAFAPIDPNRTYRITGTRGTSAYFSLTVYNEPSPGAWSDKVIGVINDEMLQFDVDGGFELMLGPSRPDSYDGAFIELSADAAVAFTRDYQVDPLHGTAMAWTIEAVEEPDPIRRTDAETAAALRSTLAWIRTLFAIVPLAVGVRAEDARLDLGHEISQVANEFGEPYRVPDFNFGWSATDACYSFGSYVLTPDEALVITHQPPTCRFWNIIIWDQFMAGHNAGDARISLNHGTATPNADGTVTVVIARRQLEHPNALTTLDRAEGNLAFRWFLSDSVPAKPHVELVKIEEAPIQPT